eukprot:TRINITY_DN15543_c0_g1_i1.p1 TRINITY_DN15543_c0_g1~~TRINITY_DN15543_c0_g1_i1.p1  ORF type:complete len:54 (-),score=2.51 TRINITY_DN15543_c0_g1_i1:292-453(-)
MTDMTSFLDKNGCCVITQHFLHFEARLHSSLISLSHFLPLYSLLHTYQGTGHS